MSPVWKKPGIRIAAFSALLALVVISASMLFGSSAEEAAEGPLICDTDSASAISPLFSEEIDNVAVKTMGSNPVMLFDLSGERYTTVIFCSYRCPCSDGYRDRLASLRELFEPKGVAFVAMHSNADETIEGMKSYANRMHYPLDIYRDDDAIVADMLHAGVTPEAFVFDADWKLQYHGRIDDDKGGLFVEDETLKNALDTLLTGKELQVKERTALGCAITRTSAI